MVAILKTIAFVNSQGGTGKSTLAAAIGVAAEASGEKVFMIDPEIALAYDRKPHDLYIEGINLMLRSYGKGTVDEIAPNVTTFPR
jgi:cellulose biosynthesis protein BcsQ